MKVWIVNPFDELPGEGSPPARYQSLARCLVQQGHEVVWWSADFSHRHKRRRSGIPSRADGFELCLVPVPAYSRNVGLARILSHRAFGANWLKLAEARTDRADCVVASLPPIEGPISALRYRERHGARLVLDWMDDWPDNFAALLPLPRGLRRIVARGLFHRAFAHAAHAARSADAVSAPGQRYLDSARRRGASGPFHLCYLGADASPYRALAPRGPGDGAVRFVYLGNFGRSQDLRTLVEAVHRLGPDFPGSFILAGGGDQEKALLELMERTGTRARFELPGYVFGSQLSCLLGESQVALNLVRPESGIACPYKMGDYLCSGLPVLNGLTGETADLIRGGDCGWHYEAGDAGSLAAALRRCVAERDRFGELSRAASRQGARFFDRDQTYPAFARWITEG